MVCFDVDKSASTRDTNYKSIPLTRTVIASLLGGCKFVEHSLFIKSEKIITIYLFHLTIKQYKIF